jgi:zinc protease
MQVTSPVFTRTQLANGLTVYIKEVHSAPIATAWLAYRIGSRNEATGMTGISHWCEHMMFKGTQRYPAGALDKAIDRVGGSWNAFTSMDYTMYHELLPVEHIGIALDAEADRMMNAQFDPEETESERTVIISERQGRENSPLFWLREAMRASAFRVHGYHHEIIGDMTDLHTMTRDDLYNHYQRHYHPANAALIVVGAFGTDDIMAQVERYYGDLPYHDVPDLFVRPEPEQLGEKRVVVERPGSTSFLQLSHRIPPASHPDWIALDFLDAILTGPGGSIDNKTSRLYQALVKTGIAAGMAGGASETIDPYLYSITLALNEGKTHQESEDAILQAIERIQQDGITDDELQRVKKQTRAALAYEQESISTQAYLQGLAWILDMPDWDVRYAEGIASMTREKVQEVAQKYLIAQRRIIGWLLPT